MVRIGTGFDAHAFAAGRPLILGGVTIPHDQGLAGHSDADALLHAIVDALLGAAALGDIGQHFPSSDPQWRDAPSSAFLRFAAELLARDGWRVANVDATIIAERPKMAPHLPAMRANIAAALDIAIAQVSVKATTTDGLGFIGRGAGVACQAVAALEPCAS